MSAKQTANRSIVTLAVLGSLVFLNLIGLKTFRRLDLTGDRQFSLSSATVSTLQGLTDPLTIRAYFTSDLPPPYGAHARYVRDLLEEYYARSGGNVRYEFIDPVATETEEDKEKRKEVKHDIFGRAVREQTSVERELAGLGIQPVQVQVNEGDKVEVKRAYMGIAVSYGGKQEAIPVVQDTAGLEYDLTTMIRKLARTSRPKVALLGGHDGPDPNKELGRALGLLRQLYDVSTLDLTTAAEIPSDTTALLVVAPRKPLSAEEQKAIDRFVTGGGSAAFFLDAVKTDLNDLRTEEANHGLGDLLKGYGVAIEPGLVLDAECATLTVARQQGFLRIQEPVRYPFMPQPKSIDSDHPLTRGLAAVVLPFVSPLAVAVPDGADLKADVLVRSSPQSWVQAAPYDLNPFRRWTRDEVGEQGARNLMVAVSGVVPSKLETEAGSAETKPARIVVAGGATFITDQFFSPGNEALLLNVMDWLAHDDALLAVRTRGLRAAPLEEVNEGTRRSIKYANVLGAPALCVAFGLIRWRRREARRSRVSI
jgi:gliding-associated putative ABC transporter substrate-binding component GldG